MDDLCEWIIENRNVCRSKEYYSLLLTLANVDYKPDSFPRFYKVSRFLICLLLVICGTLVKFFVSFRDIATKFRLGFAQKKVLRLFWFSFNDTRAIYIAYRPVALCRIWFSWQKGAKACELPKNNYGSFLGRFGRSYLL